MVKIIFPVRDIEQLRCFPDGTIVRFGPNDGHGRIMSHRPDGTVDWLIPGDSGGCVYQDDCLTGRVFVEIYVPQDDISSCQDAD